MTIRCTESYINSERIHVYAYYNINQYAVMLVESYLHGGRHPNYQSFFNLFSGSRFTGEKYSLIEDVHNKIFQIRIDFVSINFVQ